MMPRLNVVAETSTSVCPAGTVKERVVSPVEEYKTYVHFSVQESTAVRTLPRRNQMAKMKAGSCRVVPLICASFRCVPSADLEENLNECS